MADSIKFDHCYLVCKREGYDEAYVSELDNVSLEQTYDDQIGSMFGRGYMQYLPTVSSPYIKVHATLNGGLRMIQTKTYDAITDEDVENMFKE